MPTCDFYIRCPYYVAHKSKTATITCEDTTRYFYTVETRNRHIRQFCEPGHGCRFAGALDALYASIEDMDALNAKIAKLEHQNKCKSQEIIKLKSLITRLEKE